MRCIASNLRAGIFPGTLITRLPAIVSVAIHVALFICKYVVALSGVHQAWRSSSVGGLKLARLTAIHCCIPVGYTLPRIAVHRCVVGIAYLRVLELVTIKILVVDDMETNRCLLSTILEPIGFEIREAVNGEEAVDAFHEWDPALVLMDVSMPVMDGFEATRQIRSSGNGEDIPKLKKCGLLWKPSTNPTK